MIENTEHRADNFESVIKLHLIALVGEEPKRFRETTIYSLRNQVDSAMRREGAIGVGTHWLRGHSEYAPGSPRQAVVTSLVSHDLRDGREHHAAMRFAQALGRVGRVNAIVDDVDGQVVNRAFEANCQPGRSTPTTCVASMRVPTAPRGDGSTASGHGVTPKTLTARSTP